MSIENPSILSHVSLGTRDLPRALVFYDAALAALGISRLHTIEGTAAAYGKGPAEFWIVLPRDERAASVGNGVHVGFKAETRDAVDAFHKAAMQTGGTDEGAPGPRPEYGESYYGCFVLDPDGNKIEATFRDPSIAQG